jgi:hypothetical protein
LVIEKLATGMCGPTHNSQEEEGEASSIGHTAMFFVPTTNFVVFFKQKKLRIF